MKALLIAALLLASGIAALPTANATTCEVVIDDALFTEPLPVSLDGIVCGTFFGVLCLGGVTVDKTVHKQALACLL